MPTLYEQITQGPGTYVDGYGVTRTNYEKPVVTFLRKFFNPNNTTTINGEEIQLQGGTVPGISLAAPGPAAANGIKTIVQNGKKIQIIPEGFTTSQKAGKQLEEALATGRRLNPSGMNTVKGSNLIGMMMQHKQGGKLKRI